MNLFRFAETHWHPDTGSPSVLAQTDLPRSHGEPPRYPVTAASALVVRALVRQHPSTHRTALPAAPVPVRVPDYTGAALRRPRANHGAERDAYGGVREPVKSGLRGGRPGDRPGDRLEEQRLSLLLRRDAERIAAHSLSDTERAAQDEQDHVQQHIQQLETAIAALRARNEDVGTHERMLESTKEQLANAEQRARDARTALYAVLAELRDIERSLERVDQQRAHPGAGPSGSAQR
ncbi:MAG TPA: hypothetical protein VNE00_10310 [Paraburkholderia sp.]|nr:hypothetical protein [Paraburkholderia sp.]